MVFYDITGQHLLQNLDTQPLTHPHSNPPPSPGKVYIPAEGKNGRKSSNVYN